jgi:hypothetical protein
MNSSFSMLLNPLNGSPEAYPVLETGLVSLTPGDGDVVGMNSSGGLTSWNTTSWQLIAQDPIANAQPPAVGILGGSDIIALAPRGKTDIVVAFDGTSLARVGNFTTPFLPIGLASGARGVEMFEATKSGRLELTQIPPPTTLAVQAPKGSTVILGGIQVVGNEHSVWPGVYSFLCNASGYITGQQIVAVLSGQSAAAVTINLGPLLSSLAEVQFWFSAIIAVLAVVAFVMLICLLFPVRPIAEVGIGPTPPPARAASNDNETAAKEGSHSEDRPKCPE